MFVRPRAQLRHAYTMVGTGILAITLVGVIGQLTTSRVLNQLDVLYRIDPEVMVQARNQILVGTGFMVLTGLISLFGIFAFSISLGHRFFGPLVPLNAQLDRMMAGDYSKRAGLRKGDELHELAAKINALAEKLEKK